MASNTDKSWYQVQTQSVSCSYHYEIFPEVLAYEFTAVLTRLVPKEYPGTWSHVTMKRSVGLKLPVDGKDSWT